MYLYNDVQQWWYFLVSTFAIGSGIGMCFLVMVWRSNWCRVGTLRLWWWMKSAAVDCSVMDLCFTTCQPWNAGEEDQQWWYYLRPTFTAHLTFGAYLQAIWSLYYLIDDNNKQQLSSATSLGILMKEHEGGLSFWL